VDGLWVTKSEGVRLIVLLLVFKISNLCEHNPPTSQTDRRTTYNSKTALCTIVHYSASRNKNRSAVAKVIVTSKLHLSMDHSAIGATVSLHLTNAQPPGMLPLFSAWPSVTFPWPPAVGKYQSILLGDGNTRLWTNFHSRYMTTKRPGVEPIISQTMQ